MTLPDVTVIVIAYNDAARLPVAVESVKRQTLRNLEIVIVDDASTDGTGEVADRLAADDPRITAVHLPENSGGCSRPRNVGLEHARAPYVMFLDSDDEYERHACKNLLYAAERSGADLAAGLCMRVNVGTSTESTWYQRLYEEPAVYEGIAEEPEQLWDTLSTNKLYRRAFLDEKSLRFVEGTHYEDLLFITEAYCVASRIAVVRNLVYYWKVYEDEERRSITSRTNEIENFRQRIEVHSRIKRYLRARGYADLEAVVDEKFIRHDMRLYVDQLEGQPVEYQREVMGLAGDYLENVDRAAYEHVTPVHRARAYLVRRNDISETLKATRYLTQGSRLGMDLVRRGDRIYFTEKYLDDPLAREMLDVTDLPGLTGPFSHVRFQNRIVQMQGRAQRLLLRGEIWDPLELVPDDDLRASLRFRGKETAAEHEVPVDAIRREGPKLVWASELDVRDVLPLRPVSDESWSTGFKLQSARGLNVSPLSAATVEPARTRLTRLVGGDVDTLSTAVSSSGYLLLQLSAEGRMLHLRRRITRRLKQWRPYQRVAAMPRVVNNQALQAFVYRAVFRRLPIRQGQIVFESHMGTQYSDSPKYVYEALTRSDIPHRAIWAHAGDTEGFPSAARLVLRKGWRYHLALARAEFWVDNQGLPRHLDKRRGTTYVQTWHGTPLKKMGFDTELGHRSLDAQRAFEKAVNRWDLFVVQNEQSVHTIVPAFRFRGGILRTGLPRNDVLVTGGDPARLRALREKLGIPTDRKVALYAPTFRERQGKRRGFKMPLDLDAMQTALGEEYFLLVRTHYLDAYRLRDRNRSFAADVSGHHDVSELMLLTDVLVTDYSSLMFDFANLRRPMIFFAYDYDDYASNDRGVYFDLIEVAPGPVVTDSDAVTEALADLSWHHRDYIGRYNEFVRRFCEYDTGKASETVVEQVLRRR